MKKIVYLNGEYLDEEEAKVSVFDRGFLFADGIYEVVPVIHTKVLDKKPFLERLDYSLSELDLHLPISQSDLLQMIDTLIQKNALKEGGVYLQITRGVAARNFAYPKDITPTIMAFTFEKEIINSPYATSGVKVVSVEDIRWKRRDIKSIALLGQCMSKEEVNNKGAFEGWMIEDGYVTEGTASSAYIVKDGTIITRPLSHSILPGIRRKLLLALVSEHNIKVEERLFTLEEALQADEAFLTSATTMVLPVVEIDGQPIADGKPGALTQKLRALYIASALEMAE